MPSSETHAWARSGGRREQLCVWLGPSEASSSRVGGTRTPSPRAPVARASWDCHNGTQAGGFSGRSVFSPSLVAGSPRSRSPGVGSSEGSGGRSGPGLSPWLAGGSPATMPPTRPLSSRHSTSPLYAHLRPFPLVPGTPVLLHSDPP